jgi:peptide chain release factor 3
VAEHDDRVALGTPPDSAAAPDVELAEQVARRRTFAIISHPDAGKTTLTEKLLLYGGAIHLAGSVKARRADRHATSDWMELERQRGISVTSSVLQFDYAGCRVNLLDTPGHQDFSEDTYRTLVAADSAVMLLDNRKGVEERTRQLFAVCKRRRTPIVTFVNKCDRVGADPMTLIGDVERDLGIACHAAAWPIAGPHGFAGIYDRRRARAFLFDRNTDHGASRAATRTFPLDDPELETEIGASALTELRDALELLEGAGHPFDREAFLTGELTPVYFGSALTNFGVEGFLQDFLDLAPAPVARESSRGPVEPTQAALTGFVFKIQANMDPKHRDRVAFVRICSGRFEAGMEARQVRTGKMLRLSAPQQFLARERTAVATAWPGDVIGIMDRGNLRIGDTLTNGPDLEFQDIPRFPPEHFATVAPADPLRRKQLDTGLRELSEEGAAQVFYAEGDTGPAPIVGAVGQLQFDVMVFRLTHEYGAPCRLEPIRFRHPRWVTGPKPAIDRAAMASGRLRLYDTAGNPLLLFENEWALRWALENEKELTFHEVAP